MKNYMTQKEFQQRYTIEERLGEGGFGEVFKVYDMVRDRLVALKVSKVKPELESVRLRREVEMINRLPEHPNIAYYEVCYTINDMLGEYDYGILQYYEEGNLLQLLGRDVVSYVSDEQKTSILKQILTGLEFLHEQGIIHRDLKPQNILMVRRKNGEYVPKITDFGISKTFDANNSSVFTNSLAGAGTLAFSSPEQLAAREIRKNADLWSFGVIAFRVLTGELPFTTGGHVATSEAGRLELFNQINSGRLPKSIRQIAEPWQTLIRRCLIADPAKRIKNVQEAKAILAVSDVGKNMDEASNERVTRNRDEEKNVEIVTNREVANDRNIAVDSEDIKTDDKTKIDPTPPSEPFIPVKTKDDLPRYTEQITYQKPEQTQKPSLHKLKNFFIAVTTTIITLLTVFVWNHNRQSGSFANYTEKKNKLNIKMIAVKGGTFTMGCTNEQGSNCDDSERPPHKVAINDFYIGKYEVTQAQWKAVMGTTVRQQRDKANKLLVVHGEGIYGEGDNYPIYYVSWAEVQEFISRLNKATGKEYRLPTEAEWEFAARGGIKSKGYKYSGSNTADKVAFTRENSKNTTHRVGKKSPNELGIYDMSGNVGEWCSDWYASYSGLVQDNPKGPSSGNGRVYRGGSWGGFASIARVSYRGDWDPNTRYYYYGFRLA